MKSARRQAYRCCNIDATVTVKISQGPKNRRVADTEPLVRAKAAVRIYDKDGHIIRGVVKHDEIARSITVHVTRFQVVADPQIFQNARTGLRSYRLKGSIAITQSSRNRIRAEGRLLHDHA